MMALANFDVMDDTWKMITVGDDGRTVMVRAVGGRVWWEILKIKVLMLPMFDVEWLSKWREKL